MDNKKFLLLQNIIINNNNKDLQWVQNARYQRCMYLYNSVGGGWDIEIPFKRPIFRQQQEPQSRQEEHLDVLVLLFCCCWLVKAIVVIHGPFILILCK